jgi:D-psicose/D-tagatose/L-ribulose 3-epimerase
MVQEIPVHQFFRLDFLLKEIIVEPANDRTDGRGWAMTEYAIHAMVWVAGWSNAEAERAITSAAALGYDILEIPLLDPDRIDVAATRALLDRAGIRGAISLGLSLAGDISSEDPAAVRHGSEILHKALAATRAIGGNYLGGVIYSALTKYTRPATTRGRANSVGVIRELARSGITIGIEAVNRYETNLLNTGQQVMRYLDDVGLDNLIVHLDTFHMNIEETDGPAAIRLCGDRLGYFHVNENHRGILGTGTMHLQPLFRALAEIGYDRPVGFEAFSSSVADDVLGGMAGIWRDLWQDSDAIAAGAIAAMRREMDDARSTMALLAKV